MQRVVRPGALAARSALVALALTGSLVPPLASAAVLVVGPGEDFTRVRDAARAVRDGDTVIIKGGVYEADYAVWSADNLGILGEGEVVLRAGPEPIPNGKAIWVIRGRNTKIVNVTFERAKVRDLNGAGIRLERGSLTVERCRFRYNEMGILTAGGDDMALTIRDSKFAYNTQDYERTGRLGHNVYVGRVGRFELVASEILGANTGHNVKSRARRSTIAGNRIHDEGTARASYQIDLPNGGVATIENNTVVQGAAAPNVNLVSFGAESNPHPEHHLTVRGNTFIGRGGRAVAVMNHLPEAEVTMEDNRFEGITVRYLGGWILEWLKKLDALFARGHSAASSDHALGATL